MITSTLDLPVQTEWNGLAIVPEENEIVLAVQSLVSRSAQLVGDPAVTASSDRW